MNLEYTVIVRYGSGPWKLQAKFAEYYDAVDYITMKQKTSPGMFWDFRIYFGQEILKEVKSTYGTI